MRDAVIGILELSDHVPRDFSEHLELIEGLAHVAGRALDNALLFEEIRRRNDILHELVEFGALVTGAEDLTTLLRAARQTPGRGPRRRRLRRLHPRGGPPAQPG